MMTIPQSEEAEKSLLSAWIASPAHVAGLCAAAGVNTAWFFNPFCAATHEAFHAMWVANRPFEYAPFVEAMRKAGRWGPECPPLFGDIRSFCPIPSAAEGFIEILKDKAQLRGVLSMCSRLENQVHGLEDASQVMAAACKEVAEIGAIGIAHTSKTFADHCDDYVNAIIDADGDDRRLWTKLAKLDAISPVVRGDMPAISGEKIRRRR